LTRATRANHLDPQTLRHIPELDGLRAIAVTLVMAIHLNNAIPPVPEAAGTMPKVVGFVIDHGWAGVDLFFVLSGFLITRILRTDRHCSPGLRRFLTVFYVKRALRILPLYLTVLAVFAVCAPEASTYWWLSAAFLSNYASALSIAVPHFAGVFWSLCIEEHYYLLFPLLVWFLPRQALVALLIATLVGEPLLRFWAFEYGLPVFEVIYPQTQFRLDGLAIGGLIALTGGSGQPGSVSPLRMAAGMMLAALVIQVSSVPYGGMRPTSESAVACALRFTVTSLGFGAVVLACIGMSGATDLGVLRSAPMAWIATLSYCLYLTHIAVFQAADGLLEPIQPSIVAAIGGPAFVIMRAMTLCGVAVGIAQLSWMILERPCLRLKRRLLDGSLR
jgi:peptidoglycan/LPS O-acetylase OafA/YrhL